MPKIGIIAGSGFYEFEGAEVRDLKEVTTPYGRPSGRYRLCEISGKEVFFLTRHGTPHHIPPHKINYRANIWGMKELGVDRIFSVNAVGGINRRLRPGDVVVPDQVIDMTHGRDATFYEGDDIVHIDFTMPFCRELRDALVTAGKEMDGVPEDSGTYLCVNGPRLETKAEIEYFSSIGADIVGMTIMPEACLARELEICFAGVSVVTNYAAGISNKRLTTAEVVEGMKASLQQVREIVSRALSILQEERECECRNALKDARM